MNKIRNRHAIAVCIWWAGQSPGAARGRKKSKMEKHFVWFWEGEGGYF